MNIRSAASFACLLWMTTLIVVRVPAAAVQSPTPASEAHASLEFQTADTCLACHNSLTTPAGEDVSIGSTWRASMMANSARDPYWQAAVRREIIDHPAHATAIEDECSKCHMPMARALAAGAGGRGAVFANLPTGGGEASALAADGVSCTLCHQIGEQGLGTPQSFTGRFVIAPVPSTADPPMFGPFKVDAGRAAMMHSATGVRPTESAHVQRSEMCATCHTLHTEALGPRGEVLASLPEQMPYLEWRHSAFRDKQSCQSCHMPEVAQPTPIASVLGEPRDAMSRHSFLGGNFFMLRMLNRYRGPLGVRAQGVELEAAARETVHLLQTKTASVSILNPQVTGGSLRFEVVVQNLSGHKLPTGYPSRRVWLHARVRDEAGRTVFESGAVNAAGAIQGNDGDEDPAGYEPHHLEIGRSADVQIYESVMTDAGGRVTTGLLSGTTFVKDNRLLPSGFDKSSADAEIAVRGAANTDPDFTGDGDRVRFVVNVPAGAGPLIIEIALRYQPIAYRWAQNLKGYDAEETRRFVAFYDSMAAESSVAIAQATARAR